MYVHYSKVVIRNQYLAHTKYEICIILLSVNSLQNFYLRQYIPLNFTFCLGQICKFDRQSKTFRRAHFNSTFQRNFSRWTPISIQLEWIMIYNYLFLDCMWQHYTINAFNDFILPMTALLVRYKLFP